MNEVTDADACQGAPVSFEFLSTEYQFYNGTRCFGGGTGAIPARLFLVHGSRDVGIQWIVSIAHCHLRHADVSKLVANLLCQTCL